MFKTGLLIIYIGLLGVGAFPAALEAFEDTRYAVNTKIKVPWLMADYIGDFWAQPLKQRLKRVG